MTDRTNVTLGALVTMALALTPSVGMAEGPEILVPLEASATYWTAPPPLSLNGDGVSRRLVGLPLPSSPTFFGASLGLRALLHDSPDPDRVFTGAYENFLHARVSWSMSGGPVSEGAGGATVTVSPEPEVLFELGAPCLTGGAFFSSGRLMGRVGIDWGWAYLWSHGSVTGESVAQSISGGAAVTGSPFARVPLAACLLGRRFVSEKKEMLRAGEDVCLTFTPNLYEWGWFNGGSIGLEVDL
jgi:hypothetical protein